MLNIFLVSGVLLNFLAPSIKKCARCHSEVWRDWRGSLHALAYDDPVFSGVLKKISNEKEKKLCLSCHDPSENGEGVTCYYCHVEIQNSTDTIFGPYPPTTQDLPHPTVARKEYLSGAFCGQCHDVKNNTGFLLFTTYSEWKNSQYSLEGITCQKCHMPEDMLRKPVDPPYSTSLILTAHGFKGGHSLEQLKKVLNVVLFPVLKKDPLEIRIDLTNKEAGHYFPTGIPTRFIRLVVTLYDKDGKQMAKGERIYERVVADSTGRRLRYMDEMFLYATQTLKDNRIPPRSTVHEKLVFKGLKSSDISRVAVNVYYETEPIPFLGETKTKVLLASETFEMKQTKEVYLYISAGVLLLLLILIIGGLTIFKRR